jgi:hypothetical protein
MPDSTESSFPEFEFYIAIIRGFERIGQQLAAFTNPLGIAVVTN